MANNPEKAVDTETGDIYVWDYDLNEWVKEDTATNEPVVSVDSNNDELPVQQDSVQALESKVTGLEQDVETLSLEVAALNAVVSDYNLGTTNLTIFEGVVEKLPFWAHFCIHFTKTMPIKRELDGNKTIQNNERFSDIIQS